MKRFYSESYKAFFDKKSPHQAKKCRQFDDSLLDGGFSNYLTDFLISLLAFLCSMISFYVKNGLFKFFSGDFIRHVFDIICGHGFI
ncbi:hypothetical protein HMPREF1345_01343 [Enterococcus faecium TX1337RF]|nr:hypothetical protein HMPREF1345_01343 [Enterococcus faecium TX1337RF]